MSDNNPRRPTPQPPPGIYLPPAVVTWPPPQPEDNKVPERLYGRPFSEQMYLTVAEAYEAQIEPVFDIDYDEPIEMEVHTVSDNINFIPSVDRILEDIGEFVADSAIDEFWYDSFDNVLGSREVRAVVEGLRQIIAGKIKYFMADEVVDTLKIEINNGNPLVDGQPIYKRVPQR